LASSEPKVGDVARSVEFVDVVGFGLVAFIYSSFGIIVFICSTLVNYLLLYMILGTGVAPSLTPPWLTCLQLHCRQYQDGLESTRAPHCCVLTGS